MVLREDYADGGATPTTGNITASDMNAISDQVNTNTDNVGGLTNEINWLKYGHFTDNSLTTGTGKWTALLTVSLTAQYQYTVAAGHIADGSGGNPQSYMSFRMFVGQFTAMNTDPDVVLRIYDAGGFDAASLTAVVTTKSPSSTVVTLFGKIAHDYEQWGVIPDLTTDYTWTTWLNFQGFVTPLPAGTQTAATLVEGVTTTASQTLTNKTLTSPKISTIKDANNNNMLFLDGPLSAVNYLQINNNSTGGWPTVYAVGSDPNVGMHLVPQGTGNITVNGVPIVTTTDIQTLTNKTVTAPILSGSATGTYTLAGTPTITSPAISSPTLSGSATGTYTLAGTPTITSPAISSPTVSGTPVFSSGIPATEIPNGITNGNTSRQSQAVVSGTSYYITGSNLNLPATLKAGMAVGTRFRWRVAMDKTAAGTGAFAIEIRRGTAGTTSDTADVSQSVGTQTAVIDNMVVDVEVVVTTTGATGAYYWTIVPVNTISSTTTAAGFGVAKHTASFFAGTVSSVAMNTASLKFGLSFKATTGTPTISIPMVRAEALNIC